jgi:hypothetical protein
MLLENNKTNLRNIQNRRPVTTAVTNLSKEMVLKEWRGSFKKTKSPLYLLPVTSSAELPQTLTSPPPPQMGEKHATLL